MERKKAVKFIILGIVGLLIIGGIFLAVNMNQNPRVRIETNFGEMTIELYPEQSPKTVENFLDYVNDHFYDGTVFHRVIKGFMIQGGGFTEQGTEKDTEAPIKLESNNGLKNEKYTLAMARTADPNSATSQFFINTADNEFLNYGSRDQGYAVFGKIIKGKEVVDAIEKAETTVKKGMEDWPEENVVIKKAEVLFG